MEMTSGRGHGNVEWTWAWKWLMGVGMAMLNGRVLDNNKWAWTEMWKTYTQTECTTETLSAVTAPGPGAAWVWMTLSLSLGLFSGSGIWVFGTSDHFAPIPILRVARKGVNNQKKYDSIWRKDWAEIPEVSKWHNFTGTKLTLTKTYLDSQMRKYSNWGNPFDIFQKENTICQKGLWREKEFVKF